MADQNALKVS